MKKLMTAAVAVSVLASAGAAAAAQPGYGDQRYYGDRGDYRDHQRGEYRGDRRDYRDDRGGRSDWRNRQWRQGERIPRAYRGAYVDWRGSHLRRPPYGYQWHRTDRGDYVLAAIATGLIASVILNSR